MSEELNPFDIINSSTKKKIRSISGTSEAMSQMLRAHDAIQKYIDESKASQALLEMSRLAQLNIDLTAVTLYKENLELAANLATASAQIATQAAKFNDEQTAVYAKVIKSFNAWDAANQRLLEALPKFDFSLLQRLPKSYPPNWSSDYEPDVLEEIIYKDGIPVVWVPDSQLLDLIVFAPNREARVSILMEASDQVLKDCLRIIDESENADLLELKPLAVAGVSAWVEHPEAAQALAVVVADTLIKRWLPKITSAQNYSEIGERVKRPLAEVPIVSVRQAFALAVIYSFYTKFDANDSKTRPTALSRHVTVHDASIDHFHRENSLIAIMVMSSLIRTFNDVI